MDKKTAELLSQEDAEALFQAMKRLTTELQLLSENLEQVALEMEDGEAAKFKQDVHDAIEKIRIKSKE
ncbi:hypothetical protein [Herbaspirillum huttiense]|uniref:hypothetical protein n=1 Tax=Herbaspirillum huttiense TaxID=863372 RepID=UPI003CEE71CC